MEQSFHLRYTLKKDLARITTPNIKGFLREYFFPRGNMFRYVFWFRVMTKVKRTKALLLISPFVYLIQRHYEFKYQIHANTNIQCGPGLKIVHGDGVHLNASYIGDNFTCYHSVTLGNKNGRTPRVGNNVTIYPGAVVVGDIILHDGCQIGANSFVDKSIPENEIWAGVPAKRIGFRKG